MGSYIIGGSSQSDIDDNWGMSDRIRLTVHTAESDGNLSKFWALVLNSNGEQYRGAIYISSSRELVAQSALLTPNSDNQGWYSTTVGPSSLTSGVDYILAIWGDDDETKTITAGDPVGQYWYDDDRDFSATTPDGDFTENLNPLDEFTEYTHGGSARFPNYYFEVTETGVTPITITNNGGATDTDNFYPSAMLNCQVTASSGNCWIYWGTSDGESTKANWEASSNMGLLYNTETSSACANSLNKTGYRLSGATTYYYRAYGSSNGWGGGEDWANETTSWVTKSPYHVYFVSGTSSSTPIVGSDDGYIGSANVVTDGLSNIVTSSTVTWTSLSDNTTYNWHGYLESGGNWSSKSDNRSFDIEEAVQSMSRRVHGIFYTDTDTGLPWGMWHCYYNNDTWNFTDIGNQIGWSGYDSNKIRSFGSSYYNPNTDEKVIYVMHLSPSTYLLKLYLPSWNGVWKHRGSGQINNGRSGRWDDGIYYKNSGIVFIGGSNGANEYDLQVFFDKSASAVIPTKDVDDTWISTNSLFVRVNATDRWGISDVSACISGNMLYVPVYQGDSNDSYPNKHRLLQINLDDKTEEQFEWFGSNVQGSWQDAGHNPGSMAFDGDWNMHIGYGCHTKSNDPLKYIKIPPASGLVAASQISGISQQSFDKYAAYPKVIASGNHVWIFTRGSGSTSYNSAASNYYECIVMRHSEDNGNSWNRTIVARVSGTGSGDTNEWAYPGRDTFFMDRTGKLNICITMRYKGDGAGNYQRTPMYMYSDDQGTTWYNIDGEELTLPAKPKTSDAINAVVLPNASANSWGDFKWMWIDEDWWESQ